MKAFRQTRAPLVLLAAKEIIFLKIYRKTFAAKGEKRKVKGER